MERIRELNELLEATLGMDLYAANVDENCVVKYELYQVEAKADNGNRPNIIARLAIKEVYPADPERDKDEVYNKLHNQGEETRCPRIILNLLSRSTSPYFMDALTFLINEKTKELQQAVHLRQPVPEKPQESAEA